MANKRDIHVGEKFGRLTVTGEVSVVDGNYLVPCLCECGTEKMFHKHHITRGLSKSCGCLQRRYPDIKMGDKFERLLVIGSVVIDGGYKKWPCRCDCSKEKLVHEGHLKRGLSKSCGCLAGDKLKSRHRALKEAGVVRRSPTRANLTGQKFNRWLVIDEAPQAGKERRWNCVCECGEKSAVFQQHLKRGMSKSCGCLAAEVTSKRSSEDSVIHGYYGTPTYVSWQSMKNRGTGKESRKNYADRGITMCDRWHSFENFLADMGERPEGTSIDRIDNDKGYYPENCRWADAKTQQRNTRQNRLFEINGETKTMVEWAEVYGISYVALKQRVRFGMPIIEALTLPVVPRRWDSEQAKAARANGIGKKKRDSA